MDASTETVSTSRSPRSGAAADESAPVPATRALTVEGVSKFFGSTVAVDDVSFELLPGAVLALVGENGAGKSTVAKMIGGVYRPDRGSVLIDGVVLDSSGPLAAHAAGIAIVHQHPGLFPDLSIAENIFFGRLPTTGVGTIDHRAVERRAREIAIELGLTMPVSTRVGSLRVSEQQLVEIGRALAANASVIVFDEPTAALTSTEVDRLFSIIDLLRGRGVAMMFVGHRLEEVFAISDRIAVMRDGRLVGVSDTGTTTQGDVVRMMVGRQLDALYPERSITVGEPVLTVSGASAGAGFADVDFEVRAGEVVGFAGLVGSGRTEVARAVFGMTKLDSGRLLLGGRPYAPRSSADALRHGVAYVSEDRRGQSVIEDFSILDNATLPVIGRAARAGIVRRRLEHALVDESLQRMRLKFADFAQPVRTLSGGNQQKVVLAKWLATAPRLLILDEPTQGIDIQAKAEVHRIVGELAAQGLAILLISSDLPELLGMCDRIFVMRQGRIVAEFDRESATPESIGIAATGATVEGPDSPSMAPRSGAGPSAAARVSSSGDSSNGQLSPPRESPVTPPLRALLARRESSLAVALAAIVLPVGLINPRFFDGANLGDIAVTAGLIGIVALGQMLVMLTRNIDLSVASTIGLTAYLSASAMKEIPGLPPAVGVILAIAVGIACGGVNGSLVAFGGVPSIVVTLGTLAVFRGITSIIASGKQIASSEVPAGWKAIASSTMLGVNAIVVVAVVSFAIVAAGLYWTRVGREVYAVGSNPEGAELIGIRASQRILLVFVISGALAGLCGALWAARYATVDGQAAVGVELTVIASVVVGGVSLRGGVGTVIGVALGTFALLVIQNVLTLARVDPQYLQAVYGAAILLAVSVDAIVMKRGSRRGRSRT